jgi:nitroreductase
MAAAAETNGRKAVDHVLTTTRAVRRRLDLDREVPIDLIREALQIASQAPSANHAEPWRFVVITDPGLRDAVGEMYGDAYRGLDASRTAAEPGSTTARVRTSSRYLAEVMPRVPVQVACFHHEPFEPAAELTSVAKYWASVLPAVWSFQLALRSRGLGSCLTTVGLSRADEMKRLLEVPEAWTMVALVAVGEITGTDFRPAPRRPLDEIVTWR